MNVASELRQKANEIDQAARQLRCAADLLDSLEGKPRIKEKKVTTTSCCASKTVLTLPEVSQALESLAYNCQMNDGSIITNIAINERKFPVVITIGGPNNDRLLFNVRLCELQNIAEGEDLNDQIRALAQLLSMNTELDPFAAALLDAENGIDPSDPVVLLDSIQIGDLSIDELDAEMNSARSALHLAISTIQIPTN